MISFISSISAIQTILQLNGLKLIYLKTITEQFQKQYGGLRENIITKSISGCGRTHLSLQRSIVFYLNPFRFQIVSLSIFDKTDFVISAIILLRPAFSVFKLIYGRVQRAFVISTQFLHQKSHSLRDANTEARKLSVSESSLVLLQITLFFFCRLINLSPRRCNYITVVMTE